MNNPALYAASNPFQIRDAQMVLDLYGPNMDQSTSTDCILDIGCGEGKVTCNILAPACDNYHKIVGVDISEDMVKFARTSNSDDRIHFLVLDISQDVRNFRNTWGPFSKIYSFYCLHWIKAHDQVLKNIEFLLETGGECLLVFVAQCPVFEMYERLAKTSRWEQYMKDADRFVPSTQHSPQPAFEFVELMKKCGLDVVSCSTMDLGFTFKSIQTLKDCMCAVSPFLGRIPDLDREDYVNDSLRTLSTLRQTEEANTNENSGHNFTYKLLVAHARKP